MMIHLVEDADAPAIYSSSSSSSSSSKKRNFHYDLLFKKLRLALFPPERVVWFSSFPPISATL